MPRDGSGNYTKAFPDVVTNTTIASAMFNGTINDIATDLNTPRPIVAGGTGANNATQARLNMQAERAMQVVTNFDSQPWETGSFSAAVGATGSPDGTGASANVYAGTVEVIDGSNIVVEARNLTTGTMYMRKKTAGTWSGWTPDSGAGAFVLKAGDTMTGDLSISKANPVLTLSDAGTASNAPAIYATRGGHMRWIMHLGAGGESTGNAGSDFYLYRCADDGSLLASVMRIGRADGAVTLAGAVTMGSDATVAGTLSANGYITTTGSLGSSAGVCYLGTTGTHYVQWDGSNYQMPNGHLYTAAGRVYGTSDGTPIWGATGGTLNGIVNGSGQINLHSSASPIIEAQPTNDANAGFGVLNAAGGAWALLALGNGNLTISGAFSAGPISGTGMQSRAGNTGVHNGYLYDFNWTGAALECYIGPVNIGNVTITSDYRIKNNVVELPSMWAAVKALRPISYSQAALLGDAMTMEITPSAGMPEFDPEGKAPPPQKPIKAPLITADALERWGFIAHELQETLLPTAATGVKDAPNILQSINIAPVVAALTRALQEAMARIEALEAAP